MDNLKSQQCSTGNSMACPMPRTTLKTAYNLGSSKLSARREVPFSGVARHQMAPRRQSIKPMAATKGTFSTFEEMVEQSELVLVDFYATWCGPCQMMSQIMVSRLKTPASLSS